MLERLGREPNKRPSKPVTKSTPVIDNAVRFKRADSVLLLDLIVAQDGISGSRNDPDRCRRGTAYADELVDGPLRRNAKTVENSARVGFERRDVIVE